MKSAPRNVRTGKEMLNSDLRYFKQSGGLKSGLACDSSGVTSFSSNASMHYRKFSAEALVLKALKGLSKPKGCTVVAIKKYITNHYPYVDTKFSLSVIRKILRTALHNGKVVLAQGTDMEGLFKISADEMRAIQQKQKFKQVKACVKLRAQQKMALEERVQACRAKEEQKRRLAQERLMARLKRQKDNEAATRAAKAKITEQAAKTMLGLVKQHPMASATLVLQPNLRLSAGNSKCLIPKPQIVDYADAAIETAKVISSEQMKRAIIQAAEYRPQLIPAANNNNAGFTPRCMPIKYERTVRNLDWDKFYFANQIRSAYPSRSPASNKASTNDGPKQKEYLKGKKLQTKLKVNVLASSQQPTSSQNAALKKNFTTAKNVRKATKRPHPNATTHSPNKISKIFR